MRVAVVHEWLTSFAGSERVVEQILAVFPEADLFCIVDCLPEAERGFLGSRHVHTSFLQRLPGREKLFRKFLWLLPSAVESFDFSGYDLIISSSHAVAKGAISGPNQLHICYCHSPIRYAWDQQHEYLRQAGLTKGLRSIYARATLHYMRLWDLRTTNSVDTFVSNSRFVARRIEKLYRRDSVVIHPPVDTESFPFEEKKENYYITISRLVPYKRVDLLVNAFASMPKHKLIIIGEGANLEPWRRAATPNVNFMGFQSDEVMRPMLSKAKAFVFAAEEDFGIGIVEAQACGTPVICYGRGGALDTVISGRTGIFFNEQTPDSVREAVIRFEAMPPFDPFTIKAHADQFSICRFRNQFQNFVLEEWHRHTESLESAGAAALPVVVSA